MASDDNNDAFFLDYFWDSAENTLQLHLRSCEDYLLSILLSSTKGLSSDNIIQVLRPQILVKWRKM